MAQVDRALQREACCPRAAIAASSTTSASTSPKPTSSSKDGRLLLRLLRRPLGRAGRAARARRGPLRADRLLDRRVARQRDRPPHRHHVTFDEFLLLEATPLRGRDGMSDDCSSAVGAARRGCSMRCDHVVLWGVWGAFTGSSAQHGFPDTLVYCVWSLTMIPPALHCAAHGRLAARPRAALDRYGMAIGLLGAGGQMMLFYTLTRGPAYLIFPIISLSPVVTIVMSFALLGERTGTARHHRHRARADRAADLRFFAPAGRLARPAGPAGSSCRSSSCCAGACRPIFMKLANNSMSRGKHLLLHDARPGCCWRRSRG